MLADGGGGDDDVVVLRASVSLLCPLGGERIKRAVIGRGCKHMLRPFDATTFTTFARALQEHHGATTAPCPVCARPTSAHDMPRPGMVIAIACSQW